MTIFLGFGALQFVGIENIMAENKAGNTAAPLLAQYLGGEVLKPFISAVAFATILAVDSGLVLTGASANLPVIIYTIYWKKFNSTGAVAAIFVGKPLVDLAVPSGYHYAVRFLSGIYRISNWCEKT